MQVERRVDVDRARRRVLGLQLLAHVIDEVRRLGLERAGGDAERLVDPALGARLGEEAGFGHRAQHDVPAILRALGIVERRQPRGGLNHAGDCRRFHRVDVGDVLPEEQPRRFGDPVNRERSALPERHVVQIQLQDLVFGEPRLEHDRHEPFGHLPLGRLLRREEGVLDQLLRDRAAAGGVGLVAEDVAEHRAGDADGVDARVVVEAPVLDRQHRLDHRLRDHLERDVPPFLARVGDQRGDERRVQRDAFGLFLRTRQLDRIDPRGLGALRGPAAEHQADDLALMVSLPRNDHHRVPADRELARLLAARTMGVAEVVEPIDELPLGERLPAMQLERAREDARIGPRHLPAHAGVDHPGEDHPVVGHHRAQQDERDAEAEEGIPPPARRQRRQSPPEGSQRFGPLRSSGFSFDGGHRGSEAGRRASLLGRPRHHNGSHAHCILAATRRLHES